MADLRDWLDRGNKSASRIPDLMTILIRQARNEKPITYGEAARELGIHHRAVHHIAGYIGFTLYAVGESKGWKRRRPPPIHALIVNNVTRLPGSGIDGFLSDEYQRAKSNEARRAVLRAVYASASTYEHWSELCDLLEIEIDEEGLTRAVHKAREARGRGGEGPHHLALKNFIAEHPEVIGLVKGSKAGKTEWPTASGDRIDVVFERRERWVAVEVKPSHAPEADMLRGVFQCLKYRAVLEAECAMVDDRRDVQTLLILGGQATRDVIGAANALGIPVMDEVTPFD